MDSDEQREQNLIRVGRRAGQRVRTAARYGDLRRLLTFTNGGAGQGWETLRESLLCFGRWYRAEGRALLGDTALVIVPERGGERGRVHLHAAIRAGYRLDYRAIIASWSAHLEREGFHSATGTHRFHAGDDAGRHSRGFSSARVCAAYLAKYIAKGFTEDGRIAQERRYRIEGDPTCEPVRHYGYTLLDVTDALREDLGHLGLTVTAYRDHEGQLAGYWFDTEPPDS